MDHDAPKNCDAQTEYHKSLDLLNQYHDFPCCYMFKVIGYNADGFLDSVQEAAQGVLGPLNPKKDLRSRPSREGRYLSVTIETGVHDAQQVLAVYAALKGLEGVVTIA